MYVSASLRTPAKVEQAVIAQSIVHSVCTYTIPVTVAINGLSFTPSKICLARETQRKYELLHFRYVAK
jgi:hypothetical protein